MRSRIRPRRRTSASTTTGGLLRPLRQPRWLAELGRHRPRKRSRSSSRPRRRPWLSASQPSKCRKEFTFRRSSSPSSRLRTLGPPRSLTPGSPPPPPPQVQLRRRPRPAAQRRRPVRVDHGGQRLIDNVHAIRKRKKSEKRVGSRKSGGGTESERPRRAQWDETEEIGRRWLQRGNSAEDTAEQSDTSKRRAFPRGHWAAAG
ncbi:hypothetical protein C2845_PM10G08540 [Panicum miliaceum]|uniref:Uncharacterized protein n=1 Tax=Panicum miliaceum TaxID=4540 RepID=A0A3L6PE85_PANMI|nr:hypothetical protein C2845_PM10G08540 [Panicum miliaceum]